MIRPGTRVTCVVNGVEQKGTILAYDSVSNKFHIRLLDGSTISIDGTLVEQIH